MTELREKIVAEVLGQIGGIANDCAKAEEAADAILAIPEIRDALAMYNGDNRRAEWARMVDRRYPD